MSQETQIGNLNSGISDEDSRLVDSILNDLNQGPQQQQQQQQQQPQQQQQQQQPQQQQPQQDMPSPEQQRAMMMQRQQQLAAMQQMQQQQMGDPKQNIVSTGVEGIIDNIKNESKSIGLIILLSIVMNVEQVDNLFKMQEGLFMNETGSLNIQSVLVKAILVGILYYVIKSQLF